MCLYEDKKLTRQLRKERKPEDWIIVWKRLLVYGGEVVTPHRRSYINLNSQLVVVSGRIVMQHAWGNKIYYGGVLHAYCSRAFHFDNGVMVKCYMQVKNIKAVGQDNDIVASEYIIDDKDLNRLRKMVGLKPIKFVRRKA